MTMDRIINKEQRIYNVRMMHDTMLSMNNEEAYAAWIYVMPDEPSEYDFEDFAEDNEAYDDLVDTFDRIFNRYRDDGLYMPEDGVLNFLRALGYLKGGVTVF